MGQPMVTHQLNIDALVGGFVASGEGLVLRRNGARLEAVGRLPP